MAKIMLVEDDNNLREIYGARLLAEGYEIVAAKDGEEALATAVKEKPDLIISDVMMPRISGFDMLDILRNAPETKFTKVIMMTALSQAEDKARADSLGADRYLVKSQVTLEDVARVVKDVLEGNSDTPHEPTEAKTPEQQAPASPTPDESPVPSSDDNSQALTQSSQTNDDTTQATSDPVTTTPDTPEPTPQVEQQAPAVPEPIDTQPESQPAPTPPEPVQEPQPAQEPVSETPPVEQVATPEPQPAPPIQINVELPSEATNQPIVESSQQTEEAPLDETSAQTEDVAPAIIGPNLNEALEQEENEATHEAQTNTQPSVPSSPDPTLVNGAVTPSVVEPSQPAEETPEATTSPSEPESPEATPIPDNPLDDTKKKVVIQPINDITNGPDMEALLEKEQQKAPVVNPGAESVITPSNSPQNPPSNNNQSSNEHDIIAL